MAYCVNCGVELQKGEPRCPLCGIESVNPLEELSEAGRARPYPLHVETLNRRIDRRYTAMFLSLLLLIPLFVCAFCDLMIDGRLSWSAYVLGGLGLSFVWFLLPFFLRRRRLVTCVLLDGAAAAGMLVIIERMTGGAWFLTLGLPLTVLATLLGLLAAWLLSPGLRWSGLMRAGVGVCCLGVFIVLVEGALMLYHAAFGPPRWSMYAFFPCLVIGAGLLLLDHRADMKEELRRRFFV
ncbi:MAG: DUF6320 domain-containing protein [Clostridia bacterium]|nr:DUF6320 domain-containing protein [Clostridia bacterium]